MNDTHTQSKLTIDLFKPKYWLLWFFVAIFRCLVFLPLPIQLQIGKGLGLLFYALAARRRYVTEVNIALCFPEKTKEQQQKMVKDVFANAGAGIFESLCAWWRPAAFDGLETIEGLEYFHAEQQQNKPILLLGVHSTILDLGGLLLSKYTQVNAVYRPQNSPVLDWVVCGGRKDFCELANARKPKSMAKTLATKGMLWYSPDQDFGLKHGVMSKFFGIPAASITAGRRFATDAEASVLAVHFYRTTSLDSAFQKPRYHITLTPKLENYPSNDEAYDALCVNELLETLINKDATQYMWFHKRFKTQPDGVNFYKKPD